MLLHPHISICIAYICISDRIKQSWNERQEAELFHRRMSLSPKVFYVFKTRAGWKSAKNLHLNRAEASLLFPVSCFRVASSAETDK